jgi:DNA repair protein RadC
MESPLNYSNLGEVEVSYKYKSSLNQRPKLSSPHEVFEFAKYLFHQDRLGLQEQFIVIYLNKSNKVIGSCNLFTGSISACVVDVKLILATGLKLMAHGVIVLHNHPSGNMQPSDPDISLTNKIKYALELLDMTLLDHLIVSPDNRFIAFSQEGYL